jgi:hypothetical protein
MNKAEIDKLKSIIKDKQKQYEEETWHDHYCAGCYDGLKFALDEVEKLDTTEEPDAYDEYGRAIKYVDDGRGDY